VDQLELTAYLNYEILGNSVAAWLASIALFLLAWVALAIARRVVRKRILGLVDRDSAPALQIARHAADRTAGWFLFLLALFAGSRLLAPGPWTDTLLPRAVTVGLVVQLGLWATAASTMFLTLRRRRQLAQDPGAVAAIDFVGFVLRLVVWAAVLLVLLQNLGVDITALIAGLGVGGIAVALAAQSILGDLFASLSIVLDKPFVVGDFVAVGEFLGSVEYVGLKTTRLRSLSGEQVIFSNADLLSSRIRNYGRMFERRIVFSIGVVYETPADKVRRIPAIVREIVESQQKVRLDRVHFRSFGNFALEFEVVYFVLTPEYNSYMDVQQTINLAIFDSFAAEGIEFAYPTQKVFVAGPAS
jgi:small-conductance mechanosensitive channel